MKLFMAIMKAEENVVIVKGRHEVCGICRSDYESSSEAADHKPNMPILLKNKQVQKRNMVIFLQCRWCTKTLLGYLPHQANKPTSHRIIQM